MIIINTWNQNYIIAHDPNYLIDADSLNKLFISLVDKIGDNNQEIERAKRKDEYLVIGGHANIKYKLLAQIFQDFLKKSEIAFDWKDVISAEDIELFKELNFLTTEDPSIGSFGGGVTADTVEIEAGILPLVNVLNTFDRFLASIKASYLCVESILSLFSAPGIKPCLAKCKPVPIPAI